MNKEGENRVRSKLARPSTRSKSRAMAVHAMPSNIPEIGKTRGKTGSSILRIKPTKALLDTRTLPEELHGRPRMIGNDGQIEVLFQHVSKLGRSLFAKNAYNALFPQFFAPLNASRLSFMSNSSITSVGSRIPVHRRSSIARDADLVDVDDVSLAAAFKLLSNVVSSEAAIAKCIADFMLLYPALVLMIGGKKAAMNALQFLAEFLKLGVARNSETNIVFAVLIRVCDHAPLLKSSVVTNVAKLASLDASLVDRLRNGGTHRNQDISSLCKDVLRVLGKKGNSHERFATISNEASEETAIKKLGAFVDMLEDNGQPSDIVNFVRNITTVMCRFKTSAVVLERAACCVESVLPFCRELPVELVYENLSICMSVLSGDTFLSSSGSFGAAEALQTLFSTMIDSIQPEILMRAITGIVAQSTDKKLEMALKSADDYCRVPPEEFDMELTRSIYESMNAFHADIPLPSFLARFDEVKPVVNVTGSIEKMCNPDGCVAEIDRLVSGSTDGCFHGFPDGIRGVLQAAWIMQNKKNPESPECEIINEVADIEAKLCHISDEDLAVSEFGMNALTQKFAVVQ